MIKTLTLINPFAYPDTQASSCHHSVHCKPFMKRISNRLIFSLTFGLHLFMNIFEYFATMVGPTDLLSCVKMNQSIQVQCAEYINSQVTCLLSLSPLLQQQKCIFSAQVTTSSILSVIDGNSSQAGVSLADTKLQLQGNRYMFQSLGDLPTGGSWEIAMVTRKNWDFTV